MYSGPLICLYIGRIGQALENIGQKRHQMSQKRCYNWWGIRMGLVFKGGLIKGQNGLDNGQSVDNVL